MIDKTEKIKELIQKGFDIELLAFELDIPIEQLKNIKKSQEKEKRETTKKKLTSEKYDEGIVKDEKTRAYYKKIIDKYKKEIASNPQDFQEKRNFIAFAYLKLGKIDEARAELVKLIEEIDSFMAYRQLIYIEKLEGNIEDAKSWAYIAIDKFPNDIEVRKQLISIAKLENDNKEINNQLKNIDRINLQSMKNIERFLNYVRFDTQSNPYSNISPKIMEEKKER